MIDIEYENIYEDALFDICEMKDLDDFYDLLVEDYTDDCFMNYNQ